MPGAARYERMLARGKQSNATLLKCSSSNLQVSVPHNKREVVLLLLESGGETAVKNEIAKVNIALPFFFCCC